MGEKQKSVLIVDDDKFLVELYRKKFAEEGWEAQGALSASEALQKLRDGFAPSVIMFDMVMPGTGGEAFLRATQKEKLAPHAATVALTNQSELEARENMEALGVSRYIVKASAIPSEVVEAVKELAAKKQHGV